MRAHFCPEAKRKNLSYDSLPPPGTIRVWCSSGNQNTFAYITGLIQFICINFEILVCIAHNFIWIFIISYMIKILFFIDVKVPFH